MSKSAEGATSPGPLERFDNWASKNPGKSSALKWSFIGFVGLVVVGSVIGLGVTGGFDTIGSWMSETAGKVSNWFHQTAWPDIVSGFTAKMQAAQALLYVALPIGALGGLTIGAIAGIRGIVTVKTLSDSLKAIQL